MRAEDVSIVDDLIWYRAGGKYGVMDIRNTVLIKPQFEEIHHYQNGMTSVGIKNCFGMVYKGKVILPLNYSNHFSVDSIGYFIAYKGCSEDPEAYIIGDYSIYHKTGKLISQGCEKDIRNLFFELVGRENKASYDTKIVSNEFTIKLIPSGQYEYVKKGIYNRDDSLIFSCSRCNISDNINGEFFIFQRAMNDYLDYETYTIDTLGKIKIRGDYDRLYYEPKYGFHLYEKGNEKGLVDINGRSQILAQTDVSRGVEVISKNRFLLSIRDSTNALLFTICDASGNYLFAPTKDWFRVISDDCLVRKTSSGYNFTNADGEAVSCTYDSVFVVPDFHYSKMVLGDNRPRVGFGPDVHHYNLLDRDGFLPVTGTSMADFYGIIKEGKLGLYNVGLHKEIFPEYSLVSRVNRKLFAAKKGNQWLTINDKGELKSFGKSKYINFFGDYIVVGN